MVLVGVIIIHLPGDLGTNGGATDMVLVRANSRNHRFYKKKHFLGSLVYKNLTR